MEIKNKLNIQTHSRLKSVIQLWSSTADLTAL